MYSNSLLLLMLLPLLLMLLLLLLPPLVLAASLLFLVRHVPGWSRGGGWRAGGWARYMTSVSRAQPATCSLRTGLNSFNGARARRLARRGAQPSSHAAGRGWGGKKGIGEERRGGENPLGHADPSGEASAAQGGAGLRQTNWPTTCARRREERTFGNAGAGERHT